MADFILDIYAPAVVLEITSGAPPARVTNRVWDETSGVSGNFVSWQTLEPDVDGEEYPGPGEFGVDTSDFCIEVEP